MGGKVELIMTGDMASTLFVFLNGSLSWHAAHWHEIENHNPISEYSTINPKLSPSVRKIHPSPTELEEKADTH